MDFDLSKEQRALQLAARTWFSQNWQAGNLRQVLDGQPLPDLRRPLAEMGFLSILTDGGAVLDLALVAEEAGRALAPAPLIGTAGRAVLLLQGAANAALLAAVTSGDVAVAVLDGPFSLAQQNGSPVVSGTSEVALDLGAAQQLLLLIDAPGAPALVLVERGDRVLAVQRAPLDVSRDLGTVVLDAAPATVLLTGDAVLPLWGRARLVASVLLAAEDLGTIERSLEMTVAYANDRHTFGRSIGSYQAVKHACVDAYVEQELLRSLVWLAAWTADADPDNLPLYAAAARALASSAVESVTESLIQIHGGIGFTWEHDAHLYWRRAKVDRLLLGGIAEHRDTVARLALASVAR